QGRGKVSRAIIPTVYTPAMLADRWACSERHVRNMIDRGELPAFRLGGKLLRIRLEAVEAYGCQTGASPDCADNSRSLSSRGESVVAIHSEPTTRARLSVLRQHSSRSRPDRRGAPWQSCGRPIRSTR